MEESPKPSSTHHALNGMSHDLLSQAHLLFPNSQLNSLAQIMASRNAGGSLDDVMMNDTQEGGIDSKKNLQQFLNLMTASFLALKNQEQIQQKEQLK